MSRQSTSHPLDRLTFTSRVRKRAQFEAFAFTLVDEDVLVRNESYADPDNHEYRVTIHDGLPVACTCPADAQFDGACKHRVAVAMRRVILETATKARAVTDGGAAEPLQRSQETDPPVRQSQQPSNRDASMDTEACAVCATLDALPCWECFRTQ